MDGNVIAVCISEQKGTRKQDQHCGELVAGRGLRGDAHNLGPDGRPWHRQISLLALESIKKMQALGLDVGPGDFAENLTTAGLDLPHLPVGSRLCVGQTALLEITQIGKECHRRCAIYYQAGDCVMPREGVFARIVAGGLVRNGDPIELVTENRDAELELAVE